MLQAGLARLLRPARGGEGGRKAGREMLVMGDVPVLLQWPVSLVTAWMPLDEWPVSDNSEPDGMGAAISMVEHMPNAT